jgi:hypothetical protein
MDLKSAKGLYSNKNPKPPVIKKWLPNAGLEGLDQTNIHHIYKGLRLLSSQIMPNGTHEMPLYDTFWLKICREIHSETTWSLKI